MWVFDKWSPYSYQNNREKYKDDEEKREFNLKECLWFCMTSLTPQGGGEAPKNLSGTFRSVSQSSIIYYKTCYRAVSGRHLVVVWIYYYRFVHG